MPSALNISSIVSDVSLTALVAVSGVPIGSLSLWASRVPDVTKALPLAYTGSGPYSVTFECPGIWYVWANDEAGFSLDRDEVGNPLYAACFVGANDTVADEIGQELQSWLWLNKQGIECVLRERYPKTTLKQVQYGFGGNIVNYPSIVIANPRWSFRWAAFPLVREWTYTFTIACLVAHAQEQSELPLAVKLSEAAGLVLNNPFHLRFSLPSGIEIYNSGAMSGDSDEFPMDDTTFVAAGSVVWTGQALLQDMRR